MNQIIKVFFEEDTQTFSYVLADPKRCKAAVIDPVLGFDPVTGRTDSDKLDEILAYLEVEGLELDWVLETHAHADHLSGAQYLQERTGARVGIGRGITKVQAHFKKLFNLKNLRPDGSQFDRLFAAGDQIDVGEIQIRVMATPGHTSDSITYLAGDSAFVGDTLFMPDVGTARCDFPGGDAGTLYESIAGILRLPDSTRLYMCHDYPPGGREIEFAITAGEQRASNIHVGGGRSKADFVALRNERDKVLPAPRLILASLQVNIRAGGLPSPEDNGVMYLKLPLNQV